MSCGTRPCVTIVTIFAMKRRVSKSVVFNGEVSPLRDEVVAALCKTPVSHQIVEAARHAPLRLPYGSKWIEVAGTRIGHFRVQISYLFESANDARRAIVVAGSEMAPGHSNQPVAGESEQ